MKMWEKPRYINVFSILWVVMGF